jgi:hypothetical protein
MPLQFLSFLRRISGLSSGRVYRILLVLIPKQCGTFGVPEHIFYKTNCKEYGLKICF